jgi:hypothetical protein
MSDTKPVRCQKCGKPMGYVTVFGEGTDGFAAVSSKMLTFSFFSFIESL